MSDQVRELLSTCIVDPPEDLVSLYSGASLPRHHDLRIEFHPLPAAIEYTKAIHNTGIEQRLGLFALDDANDSNPFCYVTLGPARGCILHLHHDGETAIEYESLSSFIAAIDDAVANNLDIDDLRGKIRSPKIPQDALVDRVTQLIADDSDGAEWELIVLVKILDTSHVSAIQKLADHSSFFVREEVALLIQRSPTTELLSIAESLANDRHSQVARPGKQALLAVKRLRHPT